MSPLRTFTVWVSAGSGCSWPGMEQPHVSHIILVSLYVLVLLLRFRIRHALQFYAGKQQFVSTNQVDRIATARTAQQAIGGSFVLVAATAAANPNLDRLDDEPGVVSVIPGAGDGEGAFEQIGLDPGECADTQGNGAHGPG